MAREPKFVARPGQIDYTHAEKAPVINCVVQHKEKMLLVLRNATMHFYPGVWNGISGFLDEPHKTIEEKVKEELREELGMPEDKVIGVRSAPPFEQEGIKYKKMWLVHPVLVQVATNEVRLDWEAERYEWIDPRDAMKFDLLPGFDRIIETFFPIVS